MEELSVKKKRVMALFIESAEKILKEEGGSNLSIRRVSSEAGYNSATLYNYFHDLEHLRLFASVKYLKEYAEMLAENLTDDMNAMEHYREVYQCFNYFAFREPEVFHNIFFGKHSDSLADVLDIYYHQLFPDELAGLSEPTKKMLTQGTMHDRDRLMMENAVSEGFVAESKAEKTMDILIAVHQNFIYEAMMAGKDFDVEEHTIKFNNLFEYIFEAARP